MSDVGIKTVLGENLRLERQRKRLTQAELATRLGLIQTSVSNYEKGIQVPSSETLVQYAELFGTTTDFLVGRTLEHVLDITGLDLDQATAIDHLIDTVKEANRIRNKNEEE